MAPLITLIKKYFPLFNFRDIQLQNNLSRLVDLVCQRLQDQIKLIFQFLVFI